MRFFRSFLFFFLGFALSALAVSAFAQSRPVPKVINATGLTGALQGLLDRPMTYTDQAVRRSTDSVFRVGGVDLPLSASQQVSKSSVVTAGRFAARLLGPVALASIAYESYGLFFQNDEWVVPETRGGGGSSFSGWNWRHHQATGSCRSSASTCSYEQAAQEGCSVAPGSNGSVWHGNYNSSAYTCRRTDTTTWTTAASKTTVFVPSYVPATDANIEGSLGAAFTADPSGMPSVLQQGISAGYSPSWSSTAVSGPSSVPGQSTTTTSQTTAGTQTTVTNNTYNLTYSGDTVTVTNTSTTTTTQPDGTQSVDTTTTSPSPDQHPEDPVEPEKPFCELFPQSIVCQDMDVPTVPPLTPETVDVSFTPSGGFGSGGSCPAPISFNVQGRAFAIDYAPICNFMIAINPVVVAVAFISALLIALGGYRRD